MVKQAASASLAGVSVLVVDDTDDSRELLRAVLEYAGALVMDAATVREALQILQNSPPEVLVTDIAMPDDGIRLVREVVAIAAERGQNLPVVAVTAHSRMADLQREGFRMCLTKPVDPWELCRQVAIASGRS